ncbi:hypothetical protein CL65_gp050 [Mycobacterium phage Patience]|uniref:Uncharacterized protein n=2 Tax=Patiencevirus patience TaxID=1982360 RepID=A0A0K1LS07_9CAUD|nr:hypothetical protein CL65_gp050 [Mycobacterium phage Patience]AEL97958.1 hypothetical protein PATIENCE_49 [Mycobacterium phage Patience]AKU45337.1 hypothetical protein MADRUGA_47 [Mycobacterium phage Madruga]
MMKSLLFFRAAVAWIIGFFLFCCLLAMFGSMAFVISSAYWIKNG